MSLYVSFVSRQTVASFNVLSSCCMVYSLLMRRGLKILSGLQQVAGITSDYVLRCVLAAGRGYFVSVCVTV